MEKKASKYNKMPFDYVAQIRNMNEATRKNKISRIKWFNEYQWLLDEYKNVQEELRKLSEEKNAVEDIDLRRDNRSLLPIPETSSGFYGWLASKRDFNLEKYGSYIVNYPNPLDEITLLPGDIPRIAPGKGLI